MKSTAFALSNTPWFSFVDRLKLRNKFALMLFSPIAGLLFFSVSVIMEKSRSYVQAESSQRLVKFAVLASALVHETQKERGMTAGFLGSKGKKFSSKLRQQRENATDLRIEELQTFLKNFNIASYGTQFASTLSDAVQNFDALENIRQQVDAQSISTSKAIHYYTGMNTSFLNSIGHISKLAANVRMANQSTAYINFLRGKERAGIERSILTNTFARGNFGPGMYQKFGFLVAEQATYLDVFHTTALPEMTMFFDKKMQAAAVAEVERMRDIAFKSGSASWLYVLSGQLYQNMALRGAYHSIKNLLIRGSNYGAKNFEPRPDMQVKYKKQFETNFQAIKGIVENILSLTSRELDVKQREDVEIIWQNVQDYHKSVDTIIHLQNQGKHLKEIDYDKAAGVKIDDKPADLAIRRLVKSTAVGQFGVDPNYWFKTITVKIGLLKDVEEMLNSVLAKDTEILRKQAATALIITLIQVLFNIATALFLAYIISRGIRRQLGGEPEEVSQLVQRIAEGNLIGRHSIEDMTPSGIMKAMDEMTLELRRMLRAVEHVANDLKDAASELDNVACCMSEKTTMMLNKTNEVGKSADEMSGDMEIVAVSTEQTSTNLNSVSATSQQADSNLQTIAAAAEEANINLGSVAAAAEEASTSMVSVKQAAERTSSNVDSAATSIQGIKSSLTEVRKQCENASQTSKQASQKSQSSLIVIQNLSESALEIDSVINVINSIAEQTKMLALNASIEAAGAGESGKGFAVVANEVKDLAKQTGNATNMILEKIHTIQSYTEEVASVTSSIADSIKQIDLSNQEIFYSVGEQEQNVDKIATVMDSVSSETGEVTRLVRESTEGITEVTRNVTELSQGIDEVTRNVTQAATGVSEMSRSVVEISQVSTEVAEKITETAEASSNISTSVNDVKLASDSIREMSVMITNQSEIMNKLSKQLTEMLGHFRM